jgi:hypothetical protein
MKARVVAFGIVALVALLGVAALRCCTDARVQVGTGSVEEITSEVGRSESLTSSTASPERIRDAHQTEQRADVMTLESSLRVIVGKYKIARERMRGESGPGAWSVAQKLLHLPELRLATLAFRDAAFASAIRLIREAGNSKEEMYCGLYMLQVLAEAGGAHAREHLVSLALSSEPYLSAAGTELLTELRSAKDLSPIFVKKAEQGEVSAIAALGRYSDAESERVLSKLVQTETFLKDVAERALEQRAVLAAPDWEAQVQRILDRKDRARRHWLPWALFVAEDRSLADLSQTLKARLEKGTNQLREKVAAESARAQLDSETPGLSFQEHYASSYLITTIDDEYDYVLIAYFQRGGAISPLEAERLRFLGYGVRAADRLAEMLREE